MKQRRLTFLCLFAAMCVIVFLQLLNHFVILERTKSECRRNFGETAHVVQSEKLSVPTSPSIDKNQFDIYVNKLLNLLSNMNDVEQVELGEDFERLYEVLNNIKDSRSSDPNPRKLTQENTEKVMPAEIQEICPEMFLGDSLTYGYPFFRKGFATLNCSQHVPMHELVTVVFDDLHTSAMKPCAYKRVLKGVTKYHPRMRVVFITRNTPKSFDDIPSNVDVMVAEENGGQGKIWKKALNHVKTKYVLIAPHLTEFDDDINLKRLVRVLSHNPHVAIVSGAFRSREGHWDIGCLQSRFINYTLTFQGGYYMSFWECVVCDFVLGPWVARTKELKELKLDENLNFGVFYDILWILKKEKKIVVSCPDVMFNVDKPKIKDEQYWNFAEKYKIMKIVESNGHVRWYGCRRGVKHRKATSCGKHKGFAVPPCDLENLADAIKFIMRECEKARLFCELQEGTLLGAVKFNKVLPWERDADLTFLTANYSAFKALAPVFRSAGFSFSSHDKSIWCCVNGRKAGGKFTISRDDWTVELYGQHLMESEILVARAEKPTKVDFAGQMVTVMRNPGLFARNRYGEKLYRHQEHWMDRGKRSGWHFYNPQKFEACPIQGHSGCLSQYSADGNMQFGKNICPCSLR